VYVFVFTEVTRYNSGGQYISLHHVGDFDDEYLEEYSDDDDDDEHYGGGGAGGGGDRHETASRPYDPALTATSTHEVVARS
jgi:hypothetical protein